MLLRPRTKASFHFPLGKTTSLRPWRLVYELQCAPSLAEDLIDSLQDVAQVAAHVLTGKGKHGFDDRHRGQMMVVTGTSPIPYMARSGLTNTPQDQCFVQATSSPRQRARHSVST